MQRIPGYLIASPMATGLSLLLEFEKDHHFHYPEERPQQQHTSLGSIEADRVNDRNQTFQKTSLSIILALHIPRGIRSLENRPNPTGKGTRNSLITLPFVLFYKHLLGSTSLGR